MSIMPSRKSQWPKKPGKYHNQKEKGFRSKFEARLWESLPPKSNVTYEAEKVDYVIHATYTPDFIITTESGDKIYVEAKGWFRPEDKRKMKAVSASNPDMDIRFILPTNPKPEDIRWCERHGFPWSAGKFDPRWLEE